MIGTKGAFSSIAGGATRLARCKIPVSALSSPGNIEDDKAAQAGVPALAAQTYLMSYVRLDIRRKSDDARGSSPTQRRLRCWRRCQTPFRVSGLWYIEGRACDRGRPTDILEVAR